jgi:hypothetical protein
VYCLKAHGVYTQLYPDNFSHPQRLNTCILLCRRCLCFAPHPFSRVISRRPSASRLRLPAASICAAVLGAASSRFNTSSFSRVRVLSVLLSCHLLKMSPAPWPQSQPQKSLTSDYLSWVINLSSDARCPFLAFSAYHSVP